MMTFDRDVNEQLQPNLLRILTDVRLSNHSSETATTTAKVGDNIINKTPLCNFCLFYNIAYLIGQTRKKNFLRIPVSFIRTHNAKVYVIGKIQNKIINN